MVKVVRLSSSDINCYVVVDGGEAVVVDAAVEYRKVEEALGGASVKYILLTHGHRRHVRFLPELRARLSAPICIHGLDVSLMRETCGELEPDILLKHGQRFKVGGLRLRVYHTPGHTKGSACFEVEKRGMVFSGDTLLKGAYGRISGPDSMGKMVISLKMLSRSLSPDTVVYPGHGPSTRIRDEVWLDGLDMLS